MKNEKQLNSVISDALSKVSELSDVNTIVGKPIKLYSGTVVIPISKMTVGFLSGGGEYGEVKIFQKGNKPYSGASGGVVSITPSGFLIEKNNSFQYINCPSDIYEKLLNKTEELVKNYNEKNSKN